MTWGMGGWEMLIGWLIRIDDGIDEETDKAPTFIYVFVCLSVVHSRCDVMGVPVGIGYPIIDYLLVHSEWMQTMTMMRHDHQSVLSTYTAKYKYKLSNNLKFHHNN